MASWCSALPPRAVCWSTDCFCEAVASVILLESSCLASRMAMSWTRKVSKSHLAEDFGLNDLNLETCLMSRFLVQFGASVLVLPGHWKSSPSRKPSVWASSTASENPWKIDGTFIFEYSYLIEYIFIHTLSPSISVYLSVYVLIANMQFSWCMLRHHCNNECKTVSCLVSLWVLEDSRHCSVFWKVGSIPTKNLGEVLHHEVGLWDAGSLEQWESFPNSQID